MAPVTFKSKAHANILMLGDVAEQMLDMMGFGKAIPGAIATEDVPRALENLLNALARMPEPLETASPDDDQPVISLQNRASPLIQLLEAVIEEDTYLRWE
ncbi:MAG: DUF1840 domain-containing protein [Pseudomonadota bacterium]